MGASRTEMVRELQARWFRPYAGTVSQAAFRTFAELVRSASISLPFNSTETAADFLSRSRVVRLMGS